MYFKARLGLGTCYSSAQQLAPPPPSPEVSWLSHTWFTSIPHVGHSYKYITYVFSLCRGRWRNSNSRLKGANLKPIFFSFGGVGVKNLQKYDAYTKRPKTKRPTYKTSQGTKRPKGQNVSGSKSPKGTNEAYYLTCVANYLIQYGQDKGMT